MKKLLLLSTLSSLFLVSIGYGQKKFNDVSPETIRQSRTSVSSLQEGVASTLVANDGGNKMTFQGSLFKNGEVFNGTSSISFIMAIDSSSNWEETHDAVSVINGLYSVVLGQTNPLPYDLFHDVNERLLEVNVDGTVLGTVKLYAPFSAEANDVIIKKVSPSSDTTLYKESAFVSWIEGEASPGVVNRGVEALAMTSGLNRGVEAWAVGEVGNDELQTGIQGYARSEGAGFTTGTWGIAEGEGTGPRYGMRGEVHGTGSTFSVAARGLNFVVPQDSGYAAGARFDVRGVGAPGAWQAGVEGLAFKDQGINVGVHGRAWNGDENWAGWFEGDVKITGRIITDGGIVGQLPLDFAGENGNRSVMLSSEGATGNDGTFRLSDENGASRVTMFANKYDNVRDSVNSTDSTDVYQRVYTGAGGAWIGGANGSQSVFISSDGPENSNGYVDVSGGDGQIRGRLAIRQFENGFARGEVNLNNNTDGRNSILRPDQLYFLNDQGSYPVGWFGTLGNAGFSQLVSFDDAGAVTGAMLTGFWGGNPNPNIWLEDENANMGVHLTIDEGAGRLALNGPNWNPNIELGPKNWENGNLPYLKMNGEAQVIGDILPDSLGNPTDTTYYHPDLVWMDVQRWDNGTEVGALTLRGNDGSEFHINSHGLRSNNQVSKTYKLENRFNDQTVADLTSFDNGAQLNIGGILNTSDTTTSYGGGVSIGGKFWENSPQHGYLHLRGPVNDINYYGANLKFALEAMDDGFGNQNADFRMFSPELKPEKDNEANVVLHINSISDNQQQWASQIAGGGSTTPNFTLGAKVWETDGTELPFLSFNGYQQVDDTINGFHNPDLIWMDVEKYTTSEGGHLNLNSTTSGHGIRMYGGADFESNGNIRSHIALDNPDGSHIYLDGTGDISASGSINATTLNQTSDARFKKEIKPIERSLSKLNQLNGYTYFWNEKAKNEKGISDENQQMGVLAQEVEKLFPQLVSTDEKGYKSVNYASLSAVLIEAIKELSTEVATLKGENESLKSEVKTAASLENRLGKLELLLGLKSDVSSSAQNNK